MRSRLSIALVALLLAGAAAAWPVETSATPAEHQAELRDGTAGAYDMILTGAWNAPSLGDPVDGLRFELSGVGTVADRDGHRVQAMRVLWEGPTTDLLGSWRDEQAVQWMDGDIVATQHVALAATTLHYPAAPTADCVLSPIDPGPMLRDCQIPGLHVRLPAGTVVRDLGVEDHGRQQWRHLQAQGAASMDWWFALDVAVPMRVEATVPGPEPRHVRLDLSGLLPGLGDADAPASALAGHALQWAPRHVWGPDDRGSDHPFALSEAFLAARNSVQWPELRHWLADHPGAYVFMADYHEHEWDALHCSWRIHLSDGTHGFSLRVTKSHSPIPLLGPEITFERLREHALAPAAPEPSQAPQEMPRIDSMWERWRDHAGTAGRAGANLWAFQILADADGAPVTQYAVGLGRSISWGVDGLQAVGLAGTERHASILVLDGEGRALRYDESGGAVRAPATSPPFVPASLPYIEPHWPWVPVAGAGFAAVALIAVLPKAAAALFTRFQPHELLGHATRSAVMDAVRAEPGIHFGALCTRLGRNPGQVRHHVRKLVDGRLLVARASPGYTCYFPYDGTHRALLQAGPLTRSDGARNLLGALASQPGACSKDLAGAAGLSPATATYHLKRMQEAGLIDARRDGKAMRMHLTPDGQQAVSLMV